MRRVDAPDLPFLHAMLVEAAFWRSGAAKPAVAEVLAEDRLRRYVEGWGRPGDAGLVALGAGGEPVGAAWYRLFRPEEPGYGFVDEWTPELSIAVVPAARGRGHGTRLLGGLVECADQNGFDALSLSVEPENPARALYERLGFLRVGGVAAWTMRLQLEAKGSDSSTGRGR